MHLFYSLLHVLQNKVFILKVFIAENVCNKLGRSTEQLDTNLEGNYGTVRNYKTPQ